MATLLDQDHSKITYPQRIDIGQSVWAQNLGQSQSISLKRRDKKKHTKMHGQSLNLDIILVEEMIRNCVVIC